MFVKEILLNLVIQYGYLGLFCSMALGIVGLPIPDETILIFADYLVSNNDLKLIPAIISSFLGTTSGITISFFLGHRYGIKFMHKVGAFFHFNKSKQIKFNKWFKDYGSWVILFGYFIPGIRHVTAITAGSSGLKYNKFAIFAYTGGILWSLTFILFGYFVGEKWISIIDNIHHHIILFLLLIVIIIITYFIIKNMIDKKQRP